MKSKKTKKKYYNGGSSNPLKDLNDMQALKRGQAYGSMLEGGGIKYKNGGANGPGDPPDKKKLTTGESIMNDGYKKIFEYVGNKVGKGLDQFKKYAKSNANPTKPTNSVFRELYGQGKNKKVRNL